MFHEIKSNDDIREFLENTNSLHDGYLISVQYTYDGITKTERGHSFEPWRAKLVLQILVTSIWDAVVEMEFEGLDAWQIKDDHGDIYETSVAFDDQHRIVWSNDACAYFNGAKMKNASYVIADSMKWQIVE